MVLDHVPEGPGLVVVAGPALDPEAFRHGDLDALHQVAVPQGLEDGVGEPEDQEVPDGFLAQVVVDPVDLGFVEIAVDLLVEGDGRVQVFAEGLFHHQPGPARGLVEAGLAQAIDGRQKGRGRQGQVKDPVAREMVLLLQGLDAGRQGLKILGRSGPQALKVEAVRRTRRRRRPAARPQPPGPRRPGPGSPRRSALLPGGPQDDEGAGYFPGGPEAMDGREEFAPHQVAGGAQNHQQVRVNIMVGYGGHSYSCLSWFLTSTLT